MPKTKKHWTKTRAGKLKLKELAAQRKTRKQVEPALEKATHAVEQLVGEAKREGYQNAMSNLDNRAREAQIELAKALAAATHACAIFVGEWRR